MYIYGVMTFFFLLLFLQILKRQYFDEILTFCTNIRLHEKKVGILTESFILVIHKQLYTLSSFHQIICTKLIKNMEIDTLL